MDPSHSPSKSGKNTGMGTFMKQTIVIGIGNSGRRDDGLGWAFLEEIEQKWPELCDFEYRYQLQIEDAELISHYERVLFVDADLNQHKRGFEFRPVRALAGASFTTHEMSPGNVLDLCQKIYNKSPDCFLLAISGISFELELGLSETGERNLLNSLLYLEKEFMISG